jgi:hypothetical protein
MNRILACAALAAFLGGPLPAAAQPTDSEAARATEFDGLRLLGAQDQDRRLSGLGIYMAYVTSDTRPSDGMYLCGAMSRDEVLSAAGTVASALQNLPDAVLSRLRLKYVVLCSQALAAGQSIGGIPVPPLDLLMLSAAGDSASLQHRTLHELYHLVEYRSGGIGDADWSSQFGSGYSNRYPGLLRKTPLGSGKPGFVSAYGETHPHEDRAELFAYLVLSPREVADLIRRTGDAVLRRKAHYLSDKCQRAIGMPIALPSS